MNNTVIFNIIGIVLLLITGLYILLVSKNLLRMLMGFEIMSKSVTLGIITAGMVNGRMVLSQTLAITVIVVEVIFIAIALAILMLVYRKKQSISVGKLTDLKG
ncbi:MAG TPA: NADH-quinone oxidoreductase subunit K [Bacillota bacterium]|nr:NADH-quinone oxidoreductase subunit K [Bacillota bacterium]